MLLGSQNNYFDLYLSVSREHISFISLELLTFAHAYFRTPVCKKVSWTEISTFFNYFNQSQKSSPVEISELFCDWLKQFNRSKFLSYWLFGTQIVRNHEHQIPFKNFSATSASNGRLLEWKIALFHKILFLADQRTFGRWRLKNWHDFSNKVV